MRGFTSLSKGVYCLIQSISIISGIKNIESEMNQGYIGHTQAHNIDFVLTTSATWPDGIDGISLYMHIQTVSKQIVYKDILVY